MISEYFKDLARGIEKKIEENPDSTNARKKYALQIAKLGEKLYSGKDTLAWCGPIAPFDILSAMNITGCFIEFVGAVLSSTGTVESFMEEAEQAGYPVDSCAYHRSVTGALFKGVLPKPDIIIGTSSPCIAGLSVLENLSRKLKKPFFILNIPQDQSESSVNYLSNQLKDMVKFIRKHTGHNLDQERFRKSIEYSNKTRSLMIEIYKLAAHVPSPVNNRILKDFGLVVSLFAGTKSGIEICTAFRDEFQAVIDSGKSGVPGEKIRLMWIQNRIQFKNRIEKLLQEKYKAVIVVDELNSVTWDPIDPKSPYTSSARRTLSIPFCSSIDKRIKNLQKLSLDYKIDGAINPCHWGCRQGTGIRGMISQGLKKVSVPVLNLEVDCIDNRNFAEGQVQTRIEAFMEMLKT